MKTTEPLRQAQDEPETVLCATVGFASGFKIYYGRGVISGQWFSGIDADDALTQALRYVALSEGERVIIHPAGPLMFPHRWLIENGPAFLADQLKKMEVFFAAHPPQSG